MRPAIPESGSVPRFSVAPALRGKQVGCGFARGATARMVALVASCGSRAGVDTWPCLRVGAVRRICMIALSV